MRLFTHHFLILLLVITQVSLWGQQVDPVAAVVIDGVQQRHVITALSTNQVLTINNLIPGETYSFNVPEDPSLPGCLPSVSSEDAKLVVKSYDPVLHHFVFQAQATSHQIILQYPCAWDVSNPPRHYISVACQTCVKTSLTEYLKAQQAVIVVEGGYSAQQLVEEVLIGGDCFDITGVTYTGNAGQIGKFYDGQTSVGFKTGMVMATGDISVCVGPNDSDNASAGFGQSVFDADLSTLSGSSATFDLANIEFDFTPTQTPLTFEFVFASEEYCEYVGSPFNDAFGFFIDGPGINGPFGGAANIAVVPGGGTYVAINNVNHLTNQAYYVNNTPPSGTLCGQTGSFLPSVNELQFDGYTRRFTATANVIPCQTYHIKLKICDIGDGIFDSAVFLRDGSFDAGGNVSVEWLVNGEPDINEAFEGCDDVQLLFDRVGGNLNAPLPVQFTITGTATAGADYSPIPFTVIIPAGQDQLIFPVSIIADLLPEGVEDIIITLNNPCSCLNPQEILLINDLPPLTALADTVNICGPGSATVTVNPEGGNEPYSFLWSNGTTDQSISPFVLTSTNYRVTITDDCGQTFVATARVIVNAPPNGQLLGPAPQLCPGQEAGLTINFNGVGPFTIEYNFNGNAQPPITDITDDPYTLIINEPGLYQLTAVIDNLGCQGIGQGALLVLESTLNLNGVVTNPPCNGAPSGSINTTVLGGQGPYNYNWQGPSTIGNIPDPTNILAGTYNVTVTDGFGCVRDQIFTVVDPAPMVPTIVNVQGVNCYTPNGGNINLQVAGGVPNFVYNWNNGATVQDPQNLSAGIYSVTVTDGGGCTKTATATVPSDLVPPVATAAIPNDLNCINSSITLDGTGSSTGPAFTYNWTANPGTITGGSTTLMPTVNQAGTYTLQVTNQSNGCTAAHQVPVISDLALPTASAGPNQTLTCSVQNITLDGSGSSQGSNFTYNWNSPNGGVIFSGNGTITPVVNTPGTYVLVVTNTTNGCTSTDDAVVNNNTTPPTASVATPNQITCTQANITLDGSASTPSGSLGFSWFTANGFILSGQSSQNPVV
ncbi:MAG: choice-of-anchor L domain-containing protein, partial [Saprospiraceae bacterium]|nr:choice-of-anchor L domain-containing protein [Saprospiraceae bacterium]